MAAPHPGKWERVLNQTQCLLSTGETAIHVCLLGNQFETARGYKAPSPLFGQTAIPSIAKIVKISS
jgi:hypothetical protein